MTYPKRSYKFKLMDIFKNKSLAFSLKTLLVITAIFFLFGFPKNARASNPVSSGNSETVWTFTNKGDLEKWQWNYQLGTYTESTNTLSIMSLNDASSPLPWVYYQQNTYCPNDPYKSDLEGTINVNVVGNWMVEQKVVPTSPSPDAVSEYTSYAYLRNFPSTPANYGWRLSFYVQWTTLHNHGTGVTVYYDSARATPMAQVWADGGAIADGGNNGLAMHVYDTSGHDIPGSPFRIEVSHDNQIYNGLYGLHQFILVGSNNGTTITLWYQNGNGSWVHPLSYSPGSFHTPQNITIGNSVTQTGCDKWTPLWVGTMAYTTYQPGSQITTINGQNATYAPNNPITTVYGNNINMSISGYGATNPVGINYYGVRNVSMTVCNSQTPGPGCASPLIVASTTAGKTTMLNFSNQPWIAQPGLNTVLLSSQDWDYNNQNPTSSWWTEAQYCYDNLGPNAPFVYNSGSGPGSVEFSTSQPQDRISGQPKYTCSSGASSSYFWQASTRSDFRQICDSGTGTGNNPTVTIGTTSGCGISQSSASTVYFRIYYLDNVGNQGLWGTASGTTRALVSWTITAIPLCRNGITPTVNTQTFYLVDVSEDEFYGLSGTGTRTATITTLTDGGMVYFGLAETNGNALQPIGVPPDANIITYTSWMSEWQDNLLPGGAYSMYFQAPSSYCQPVSLGSLQITADASTDSVATGTYGVSGMRNDVTNQQTGLNQYNAIRITQNVNNTIADSTPILEGVAFIENPNNPQHLLNLEQQSANGFILIYANGTTTVAGQTFTDKKFYVYFNGEWAKPISSVSTESTRYIDNGTLNSNSKLQVRIPLGSNNPPSAPQFSVYFYKALGNHQWTEYGYLDSATGETISPENACDTSGNCTSSLPLAKSKPNNNNDLFASLSSYFRKLVVGIL